MYRSNAAIAVLLTGLCHPAAAAEFVVAAAGGSPEVEFALQRLERAMPGARLVRKAVESAPEADVVVLQSSAQAAGAGLGRVYSTDPGPEGFRTVRVSRRTGTTLVVAGGDVRGAMYGVLDTAEQVGLRGGLEKVPQRTVRPRFPFRAIKFNLPWMSYRQGEALQLHRETCRDLKFWQGFLDMMAENRFNTLTLWNLHPFPYMIRPQNFPEASGFSDAEMAEWRKFWHALFRMARERGIEPYIVNWNIFVSPEFAKAHNMARYSEELSYKGEGETAELVERYTRECVTQVIDEYEDLAGIGITLGERMGGMTSQQRRDWIERTVVAGMRAAKRKAKLIYRAPLSADTDSGGSTDVATEQLTRRAIEALDAPAPVWVEFKYNWSHGHSSPRLHLVHGGKLTDTYWNPLPDNYRAVWTVRNEDFFVLRWGEPGFIREFISNNGEDWVGGVMVGSECYIPAKDYIHEQNAHRTWEYAWERQWLFYSLWGRLTYDPTTPDEVFAAQLASRLGAGYGQELLKAWTLASRTPLRLASFYRGTSDATLYSEGFQGSGGVGDRFISIEKLMRHEVLDPRLMSISEFVGGGGRVPAGRVSPLDLASALDTDTTEALRLVKVVRDGGKGSPLLDCELADIEAWSWMGRYLAEKLRAGVALATFRAGGNAAERENAVSALERAAGYWKTVADIIEGHNRAVLPYLFDDKFSWSKFLPAVQQDIEVARKAEPRR
jgi:hypothetical protein